MPEFYDIDVTKNLLSALDEAFCLRDIFNGIIGEEDVYVLVGEELGPRLQGPYSFVFTKFRTSGNQTGEIGVLGPVRLHYNSVVPTVIYFGHLIEEVARGW